MSSGPHPTAGPQPVKVIVGLAHAGDEVVIALTVQSPLFRTPMTVPLSDEQAHRLRAEISAALLERPAVDH